MCIYIVHVHVCTYMVEYSVCRGFESHLRQLIFLRKSDCLGFAVLLCLVVYLTLLATFFLSSLKHVYISTLYMFMYVHVHVHVCVSALVWPGCVSVHNES